MSDNRPALSPRASLQGPAADAHAEQEALRLSNSEMGTNHEKAPTTQTHETGTHHSHFNAFEMIEAEKKGLVRFWGRLKGKGRRKVGVLESLKGFVLSSCAYFEFLVCI